MCSVTTDTHIFKGIIQHFRRNTYSVSCHVSVSSSDSGDNLLIFVCKKGIRSDIYFINPQGEICSSTKHVYNIIQYNTI